MSKAPAMPMYWDAYIADTTHLTCEEHGAYLILLGAMWRRDGTVPDDDKDNARILKLSVGKWRKIKVRFCDTIHNFVVTDGYITQEKLQKTWQKTQEIIEKNVKNGSKGGYAKAKKYSDLDIATATISPQRKATIPEPEPEPIKKDTKVSTKKPTNKYSIPDNWKPPHDGIQYSINQGIPERMVQDEIDSFIAYWADRTDAGGKKSDRGWLQCWKTNCRRVGPQAKRNSNTSGNVQTFPNGQNNSIAAIVAKRRGSDMGGEQDRSEGDGVEQGDWIDGEFHATSPARNH